MSSRLALTCALVSFLVASFTARAMPRPLVAAGQVDPFTTGPASPRSPRLLMPRPGRALTERSAEKPEDIARRYLERQVVPAGELVLLGVVEGGAGVRFVAFEQRFDGIPVALSQTRVAVSPNGEVLAAMVGELAVAGPAPRYAAPALAHRAAAREAAQAEFGRDVRGAGRHVEDTMVERVLLATPLLAERAWRVRVLPDGELSSVEDVFLAESDGREIRRVPMHFKGVESGRFFPGDPDGTSELFLFPDPEVLPSYHSPLGWCTAEETIGNNVHAMLHRGRAFDINSPVAQATGDPPTFDFPFTGDPTQDVDAAVTNAFVVLNEAHDRFRALGFDEAGGAMQADSYGRGGLGGDQVYALVQYDSVDGRNATNRVRMGVGPDGDFTWMEIGVFLNGDTGELRDAAFERDLLIHEYAHGVSTRLVGNDPACLAGAQPQALAEGWSDFLAASMTDDPVIGAWTGFNPVSGQREFSLAENPLSLVQFCAAGCDAIVDGGIWAGVLWELRVALQAELGQAEGAFVAEQLVVEGMRYTPCRPTFTEARDGLLLADAALHGGNHRCSIWAASLSRGLGYGAATLGPDDQEPVFAFDSAPECVSGVGLAFDAAEYGTAGTITVELADATAPVGASVSVSSSSGDSESLTMVRTPSGALLLGELQLGLGAPVADDGILQVQDGDALIASYDMDPTVTANAVVRTDIDVSLTAHFVGGSGCQADFDDDHADTVGWDNLPGFLDAGETASILFVGASGAQQELKNATVLVTSLNPNVRILPTAPIPIGTVPRAGIGTTVPFNFTVVASASPSVVAGDVAELQVTIATEGRSRQVSYTLELNLDYLVERNVSTFQGGIETFEPGSPTAAAWTHQANLPGTDNWLLADCAGADGSFGMGNLRRNCLSYAENQGAPSVVSPPVLDVPATAVAWQVDQISWRHHPELFTSPAQRGCDADMVAVYLTNDPANIPYEDPLAVLFEAAGGPQAVYIFTSNTDTFVDQVVSAGTQTLLLTPGVDYSEFRYHWVFWNDVLDQDYEPACLEAVNQGRYRFDDFAFRYDVVSTIPEATPCSFDCGVRASLSVEPGVSPCAGDALTLDASASEAAACEGGLMYSFQGPGIPPGYGYTPESSAPAVAEDGAEYAVFVSCLGEDECVSAASVTLTVPQLPGVGVVYGDSLRLSREGEDLQVSWRGASDPATYGVYRAAGRLALQQARAAWPLAGESDGEGSLGQGELSLAGAASWSGLDAFVVHPRNPCTGEAILP